MTRTNGNTTGGIPLPQTPLLDPHPPIVARDRTPVGARRMEDEEEDNRRRSRRQKRKVTCLSLLGILCIMFICAVIVVSLRQGSHTHSQELLQAQKSPVATTTTKMTPSSQRTTSSSTTTTVTAAITIMNTADFHSLARMIDRKGDPNIIQKLIKQEWLNTYFKNFRNIENMTSADLKTVLRLVRKFVRDHTGPNARKNMIIQPTLKIDNSSLQRVVRTLRENLSPSSQRLQQRNSGGGSVITDYFPPNVFPFEYEKVIQNKEVSREVMLAYLEDMFVEIEKLPNEFSSLEKIDVMEYLGLKPIKEIKEYLERTGSPSDILEALLILQKSKPIELFRSISDDKVLECRLDELPCGINGTECYNEDQRCDNFVDCSDFADEIECNRCITFFETGPLKDEIRCDGIFDCLDGADEKNCGTCPENYFQCGIDENINAICIPNSFVCDFKPDCDDGIDEKSCSALWPLNRGGIQRTVAATPETAGLLHWKINGFWYVLSVASEDKSNFVKSKIPGICSEIIGSKITDLEAISFTFSNVSVDTARSSAHLLMNDVFIEMDAEYGIHIGVPPRDAVHIVLDCGAPPCGTRPSPFFESPDDRIVDPKDDYEVGSVDDFFLKSRIVGGVESSPYNWPSVVGVYLNGDLLCGGTVLARNWVLTAAHCFKDVTEGETVVEIFAGMTRLNSRSPFTQVRQADHVIVHGYFNKTYLFNDVALVYFKDPLIFNSHVNKVCLPFEFRVFTDEICMTVGWGSIHENANEVNNELLEVEVPIKRSCRQSYNNITTQICGGFDSGGKDACQGDSGGPLYCAMGADGDFSKHYLAGIVSHGIGCARPEYDAVYVRLSYYLDWVLGIMNGTESAITILNNRSKRDIDIDWENKVDDIMKTNFPELPWRRIRVFSGGCPSGVRCSDFRCIPQERVCDGRYHCMDGIDEKNCKWVGGLLIWMPGYWDSIHPSTPIPIPTIITTPPKPTIAATQGDSLHLIPEGCGEGYFACRNVYQCIPMSQTCDFHPDCLDHSDEFNCTCKSYIKPEDPRICDGVPDCPDWSDEECQHCGSPEQFYCDLSNLCISRDQVCDKKSDCLYKEDERYCIALIPRNSSELRLVYQMNSRPARNNRGFLAVNHHGSWNPICVEPKAWSDEINSKACQYLGSSEALSYNYVLPPGVPDTEFLKSPLTVFFKKGEKPVFDRAAPEHINFCDSGLIETTCSPKTTCGVHPLYSMVDDFEIKDQNKLGLFPWHVNLYQEGEYVCGASLVHRNWIMTAESCAAKMSPLTKFVVARIGSHRDGRFLSPTEQIRQVIQFSVVPHTGMSLGTFKNAVELTEYVNPICIPSSNWFPFKGKCVITGYDQDAGSLNRGFRLNIKEICEINAVHDYSICTEPLDDFDVCMNGWAGTLACKDGSNRYYVLGIYHTEKGGCSRLNTTEIEKVPKPETFRSVSTEMARDAIKKIISVFNANENVWYNGNDTCEVHRCPLGRCLNASQICDNIPDCEDLSDETTFDCASSLPRKCKPLNETHCTCEANELMCERTGLCISHSKFCDGFDDCGDGTDEPANCSNCQVALNVLNPSRVCDGEINCKDNNYSGSDEGVDSCCSRYSLPDGSIGDFRCILGNFNYGKYEVELTNECVTENSVCDYCKGTSLMDCSNGADDSDCLSIWPRREDQHHIITNDVFGRPMTQAQGYLYYIAYGRKYLYCAGDLLFSSLSSDRALRDKAAQILCEHEGYTGGGITFHDTVQKNYVNPFHVNFSLDDQKDFESCKLIYIICEDPLKKESGNLSK